MTKRRSRLARWSRRALVAMTVVTVLLLGTTWYLLGTQSGARFLFTRLSAFVPGKLEVAELNGPIRGPLEVRGLAYHSDTLDVHVDRIALDWRLRELLARRLDIRSLTAERVRIVQGLPKEVQRQKQGPLPNVHFSINIIVRDASVDHVELTRPGATQPLVIDHVDLKTQAHGDVVTVEKLDFAAPWLHLVASGTLQPSGDYPVNLKAAWWAQPQGMPRLAGNATIGGTFETMTVAHELTAPFASRLQATLRKPMSDLSYDARLTVSRFDPQVFEPTLPPVVADASLHLAGTTDAMDASGTVDARSPQYGRVTAELVVRNTVNTWTFAPVTLRIPGRPGVLAARGTVKAPPGGTPSFDLDATWQRLAWPLAGAPLLVSDTGRARVAGTADAYTATVDAALGGPQVPAGTWHATGRGTTARFDLASLTGSTLGANVTASGRVAWSPRVDWQLQLAADGVDPGRMMPGWNGALSVRARTEGHLEPQGPVGAVEPVSVQGRLKDQPLRADGALALAGARYHLSRAEIAWGALHARAQGDLGQRLDLAFDAHAPDLRVLMASLSGAVDASGRVTGPAGAPRVVARANGTGIGYGGTVASKVALTADVDLARGGRIVVDEQTTGLVAAGRRIESLSVRGRGTREDHRLDVIARARDTALDVTLAGGLDATRLAWNGNLARLDFRARDVGAWALVRPARLALSAANAEMRGFCWASGAARLCADAGWAKPAGWNADAQIVHVPVSLARPYLPASMKVDGAIEGRIRASADPAGRLRADAVVRPTPGAVHYPGPDGKPATFRYANAELTFTAGPPGMAAHGRVDLENIGPLRLDAALPGFDRLGAPAKDAPVRGRLVLHVRDLDFVRAFIPDVVRLAGHVDADLQVAGTVARPAFRGAAELAGSTVQVPSLGLDVRDVGVTIRGDERSVLTLRGSARSGPGTVTLDGTIPLAPSRATPAKFTLNGTRFQVANTDQASVLVSPAIVVLYQGDRVEANGTVTVPEARVEVKDLPERAVKPSKDVVLVRGGQPIAPEKGLIDVEARVRLVLGDRITLKAFGFSGKPTGDLLLIEQSGRPTTAVGQLRIPIGTFKAYGQDLTIDYARIVFAGGPIADPGLDVRAYRRATSDPNVVAGILVGGTAQKPRVTLWSNPAMSQTDQLAYVMLGHPLGQASPGEGNLVANAAQALELKGGNLLAKQIGARLGLQEARIETTGGLEEASLVLGKYLSPRVYVSYGIGLFSAANTFRIRYIVNHTWQLQAESGEGTGADVLYTVEVGAPKQQNQVPLPSPEDAFPKRVPEESGTGGTGPGGGGF